MAVETQFTLFQNLSRYQLLTSHFHPDRVDNESFDFLGVEFDPENRTDYFKFRDIA